MVTLEELKKIIKVNAHIQKMRWSFHGTDNHPPNLPTVPWKLMCGCGCGCGLDASVSILTHLRSGRSSLLGVACTCSLFHFFLY